MYQVKDLHLNALQMVDIAKTGGKLELQSFLLC